MCSEKRLVRFLAMFNSTKGDMMGRGSVSAVIFLFIQVPVSKQTSLNEMVCLYSFLV